MQALLKLGIKVLAVWGSRMLDSPVSSHADMLLHPLGDRHVIIARGESRLKAELQKYGFIVSESENPLLKAYPGNIPLNCARAGDKLFALKKAMDRGIEAYCENNNIKICNVRQGYAKCSVCVINDNAIITADTTIAKAALSNGMDVLLISEGYIELKGYSHGFIGGCCGLISSGTLAFTGDITQHPDYHRILDFLSNYKVEPLCLTKRALFDIGGIIPIMEKHGSNNSLDGEVQVVLS